MKLNINGITYLGVPDINNSDEQHGVIINKSKYIDLYNQSNMGEMTINNTANKNMIINAIDIDWNGAEIYDFEGNIQTINSTSDLLKIINKLSRNIIAHGTIPDDSSSDDEESSDILKYAYNYLIFRYDYLDDEANMTYIDKNESNIYRHTLNWYNTYVCIRIMIITNGKGRIVIPKDSNNSYEIIKYSNPGNIISRTDGAAQTTIRFDNTSTQAEGTIIIDLKVNDTETLPYKVIQIYKVDTAESDVQTLYKQIKNTIYRIPKTYYFYMGTSNPLQMDDYTPLANNDMTGYNNNYLGTGWRFIGNTIEGFDSTHKAWSPERPIDIGSTTYWYMAIPESSLNIYYQYEDDEPVELTDIILDEIGIKEIDGMQYKVFKSKDKGRFLPYEIY